MRKKWVLTMAEKEYIEKQSIIDAVRKEFDWYYQTPIYTEDKEVQNLIARVNRVVRENPAADVVEVVHAHWIDRDGKTWCSKCDASNKQYKPPYCPHCGADMRGGKDNG